MSIFVENMAFVDELYTWRVPAASALTNALTMGFAKCSVLITLGMFEEDYVLASHSLVISIAFNTCLMGLLSPLVNILTQNFSARIVTLMGSFVTVASLLISSQFLSTSTYPIFVGGLLSFGFALVYSPPLLLSGICFDRYRSRAAGICFAGESLGQMLLPSMITFLIDNYTVRGAFLILSAVFLNLVPLSISLPTLVIKKDSGEVLMRQESACSFCQNRRRHSDERPYRASFIADDPDDDEVTPKNNSYAPIYSVLAFILSLMLMDFAYLNQLTIFPLLSHLNGIQIDKLGWAISVAGVVDFFGHLGFGVTCERMSSFWRVVALGVSMGTLSVIAQIMSVHSGSIHFLFIYVTILGLIGGCRGSMWTVIITNLVGVNSSPKCLSFALMAKSLFSLILLCSMGYLYEAIRSYSWVLRIGGISAFIAMLLQLTIVAPAARKLSNGSRNTESE